MQIEFYEEFPTKENLEKLKLIKFPTKIFIAAKSVKEFKKYEKIAKLYKKDLIVAYWPIVENSYWISPFSNTKDLIELFNELKSIKNPLLIDLELPLRRKWKMYLKNLFHFCKNKKLIKRFLEKNKSRITTAQYPNSFYSELMKILGLNYKIKTEKSLMFYTSMINEKDKKNLRVKISQIKNKDDHSISLGTIAHGILGNEPILSPKKLKEDLEFIKTTGFKKVIIFRLGGLNKNYIKVLNKFYKK